MKVLLVNGSPHHEGCTNRALLEVEKTLRENGIETENFWVGAKPVGGCMGCFRCGEIGKCVLQDGVNEFREKAYQADGFIFGSPVQYAGLSGNLKGFMDRLFFSEFQGNQNRAFYLKPAAAVVSARRAGTTTVYSQLLKYFTVQEMPVVSTRYWNMVHGMTAEEVEQDGEGLFNMRVLGRNMAYFLKCQEAARSVGIPLPEQEVPVFTNFVRE
ncbi:MAG: flavodoxin family protein [Selenomonas sp.]|uniref:flavodoxin family protein n=1 Tax=Selenomonas sp. TaxID=2053611 RepID=UPI0025CE3376|nr:flavodoxin family protein [Selenomonas sp.]MCR5757855.1 flavodoxin family protein [Selenomonas sp.]